MCFHVLNLFLFFILHSLCLGYVIHMGQQVDTHYFVPSEHIEPLLPQPWQQPLLHSSGSCSSILPPLPSVETSPASK